MESMTACMRDGEGASLAPTVYQRKHVALYVISVW